MKNIIPFKKEVIFKTNLCEITSISLEHTLTIDKSTIKGEFLINGEYRINDKSISVDPFNLELPFEIIIDDRYDSKNATVDIDDFYYEIVNNNILSISIDVLVDKLEEKPLIQFEDLTEIVPVREILKIEGDNDMKLSEDTNEDNCINSKILACEDNDNLNEVENILKRDNNNFSKEILNEENNSQERINSLVSQISFDREVYVTYNVYILREGDSIDTILEKYNITEEELKNYNDLNNLKLGDKIIIPNTYEGN